MLLNRNRAEARMDCDGVAAIVASSAANTCYPSSWATNSPRGFGDIAPTVLPRISPDGPELLIETDPRLIACIEGRTLHVG